MPYLLRKTYDHQLKTNLFSTKYTFKIRMLKIQIT